MNGRNVMSELREWVINYRSHYNDGWTKQHYKQKLDEVHKFISEIYDEEQKTSQR